MWKINSWRNYKAKHIPNYPDKKQLSELSIILSPSLKSKAPNRCT